MGISWLLFKKSGKQSLGRLSLTATAIGLGIVMILSFIAGINAIISRQSHDTWRYLGYSGGQQLPQAKEAQKPIAGVAPLKISSMGTINNLSQWQTKSIDTVSLHASGSNSPEFPGMKTPAAGEYYLSPGLAKLNREHPEAHIGDRYGSKYLGEIPSQYVSSPDSLLVVYGATAQELARGEAIDARNDRSGAKLWGSIYRIPQSRSHASVQFDPISLLIMSFGAAMLLFPIVMFIGVSTQLGSTQREQRYAALRLIGATRTQINRVLLFETFMATLAGIVVGSLVFMLVQPHLGAMQYNGEHFWANDLVVGAGQYLLVVAITIGMSLFANYRGMRKVQTSPLGVARRQNVRKKPRAWRTLPLLAGLGIFTYLALPAGKEWLQKNASDSALPTLVLLAGIVLVMFGLVLSGAWLTGWIANLFAARTTRGSTLIATKRIAGNSRQIFRSVSGVVLALFAGSFYLAAVSGVSRLELQSVRDNGFSQLKPTTAFVWGSSLPGDFGNTLKRQGYIHSVATTHETPQASYIACRDLDTYTEHSCPAGTTSSHYARISFASQPVQTVATTEQLPAQTETGYLVSLTGEEHFDSLRTLTAKASNQQQTTPERAPDAWAVYGGYAKRPHINPIIADLASITYVGIGITLFIAIASLIVSTIGGLLERRRSLFTLRLGGMTLGQMKRVVLIESLIPLLSVSVIAAGIGIWVAHIFLQSFSRSVRVSLSPLYFAMLIASLAGAVLGIYLILPMLRRLTSMQQNQTE